MACARVTPTQQLHACLWKNFTQKKRNPCVTCMELLSPVLLMLILMGGYLLSTVEHFSMMNYSKLSLMIPPSFLEESLSQPHSVNRFWSLYFYVHAKLKHPFPVPSFDQFVYSAKYISSQVDDRTYDFLMRLDEGRRYGNVLRVGELHFTPDDYHTEALITYLNSTTGTFKTLSVHVHANEQQAVEYILSHLNDRAWALININSMAQGHVDYTIRMNYTTLPNTKQIIDYTSMGMNPTYQRYVISGFLSLQQIIDEWAFGYTSGGNDLNSDSQTCHPPMPFLTPFPHPAYDMNVFYWTVGFLLGLFIVMITMYPMSRLVKSVVEEKETRVREIMLIMGLSENMLHLSWFITATISFTWIASSITLLSIFSFLKNSSPDLVFLFFFTFCMSEVSFAFLVSTFFSRAKLAAIMGPVVMFVALLPRYIFFSTNSYEENYKKRLASLLSPTAFAFGAETLAAYESAGIGVTWYNVHQGGYSFFDSISFMALDFLIYGILAWYCEQVLPTPFGTRKHPLFFIVPSYWVPGCVSIGSSEVRSFEDLELASNSANVEPSNSGIQPSVTVTNLIKQYEDGKVALNGLSLNMYENQITCVLGHNGAGKTTFISILTGMISATSGKCIVYGNDVCRDIAAFRHETGICPQYNVILLSLTVKEHLEFFARLKGFGGSELEDAVMNMIRDVGLAEKANIPEHALSGGMLRKLSVGIALIGAPKFVLLDEPTSGMDPYSRRAMWELLRAKKEGRVCLLTTHFMDEADILGDRIAILSSGSLMCDGSSLFLKSRFGCGYNLTIAHQDANVDVISGYVLSRLPTANLVHTTNGEIRFSSPLESCNQFASLFQNIEDSKNRIGVHSYGVSICSLEQVFLRFAEQDAQTNGHASDEQLFVSTVRNRASKLYCPFRQLYLLGWCLARGTNPRVFRGMWGLRLRKQDTRFGGQVEGDVKENDTEGKELELAEHGTVRLLRNFQSQSSDCQMLSKTYVGAPLSDGKIVIQTNPSSAPPTIITQVIILLQKRFLAMRRDIKGLCFQVLVPAFSIVLVLMILTINYNPAGPSIPMRGDLFPVENEVLVGGQQLRHPYTTRTPVTTSENIFPSQNIDLVRTAYNTSYEMSEYMLKTYKTHSTERYGSLIFKDSIATNLTVKWPWVRDNFDWLFPLTFTYVLGEIPRSNSGLYTIVFLYPALNQPLETSTTVSVGWANGTINSTIAIINAILEAVSGQSVSVSGQRGQPVQISFTKAVIHPSAEVVTFEDVQVSDSGTTFSIGHVNVTFGYIRQLLPTDTQTYHFDISVPYNILHNVSSPHAIAAFRGELVGARYATCFSESASFYAARNYPLPLTALQTIETQSVLVFLVAMFLLIPLCYIPAAFVVFVVRERISKVKHLQTVSGVSMTAYWVSTYLWDSFLFLLLDLIVMITFLLFKKSDSIVFVGSYEAGWATFLLLFFYGQSVLPLSYLYSFAFKNHSTAQISIMAINFFTGFMFVSGFFIATQIPRAVHLGREMAPFFRIFPPFNIGIGLINLCVTYFTNSFLGESKSFFDWEVCGRSISFMAVEAVGFFCCVCLSEHRWVKLALFQVEKLRIGMQPPPAEDDHTVDEVEDDVATEQARIQSVSGLVLRMSNLQKVYPPALFRKGATAKRAVCGVSLGLPVGECFGYLGINGAGKTTTLSILTGDIFPSCGEASIGGVNIANATTRTMIGYCPQTDPVVSELTGRETLTMFARLRGVPEAEMQNCVQRVLEKVYLSRYADTLCGFYSGGNKRKLSLGIALMGDPPLLLLDEPSTGMDPYSRRQMWNVIADIARERSVMLTTHSMEEAEALCHRIGIMVGGKLRCLGTPQHLKDKYGAGYQVEVRCDLNTREETDKAQEHIEDFILSPFPHKLEERHGPFMKWHVFGDVPISLAHVFGKMEEAKGPLKIAYYSVSQCTLEHIFIRFAKEKKAETNPIHGVVY